MTRWIVLGAGVLMQLVLGGIYAWSVFVPPLNAAFGISRSQSGFVFGLMIAVFTLAMIPAGRLLQRRGPRLTASIGALLFSVGYLGASFSQGRYPILLISLGLAAGAGIGFGYVCPLTVGMRWFPAHKGLVTGVAVAGFGGGAVLLSSVAHYLMTTAQMGVLEVFRFVGLALGGVALLGALLLREPPSPAAAQSSQPPAARSSRPAYPFWHICAGMFAGTFAGLLTVGNLKPLVLSIGMPESQTALAVSLFAAGNAAGRIFWGQVHDRLRSRKTILLSLGFLGFTLLAYLLENAASAFLLFAVFFSGAGFGACFVVYASSIVEYFGVQNFPRLYPLCFLGYGLAGLAGPAIGGWIADTWKSYHPAVILSLLIVAAALLLIYLGLRPCGEARPPAPRS